MLVDQSTALIQVAYPGKLTLQVFNQWEILIAESGGLNIRRCVMFNIYQEIHPPSKLTKLVF
jgi:hypothetical protein